MTDLGTSVDWDARFMALSIHIAEWSKDQKRQYGAVIVGERRRIISTGYNGLPRNIDDSRVILYKDRSLYGYFGWHKLNTTMRIPLWIIALAQSAQGGPFTYNVDHAKDSTAL